MEFSQKPYVQVVPQLVNFELPDSPMETVRTIVFYKEHFIAFYNGQNEIVREKIDHVLFVLTVAERIPRQYFRQIAGTPGMFEIRVIFQGNIYRIFCCFDEGKIVVLFNAFQKKSQKTPLHELAKAIRIMNEYFLEKRLRK